MHITMVFSIFYYFIRFLTYLSQKHFFVSYYNQYLVICTDIICTDFKRLSVSVAWVCWSTIWNRWNVHELSIVVLKWSLLVRWSLRKYKKNVLDYLTYQSCVQECFIHIFVIHSLVCFHWNTFIYCYNYQCNSRLIFTLPSLWFTHIIIALN